jgi:hypothetical protein
MDNQLQLTEEIKTLITMQRHTTLVRQALHKIADELNRRAEVHDLSKFSEDEFAGFVQINRVAREHKYGSPEYQASLNAVEPNPVKLHYSRNSHHPEYFGGGANDMDLIDLIEMVCDWYAASKTYGQTSFADSVEISLDRFPMDYSTANIVRVVADFLSEAE